MVTLSIGIPVYNQVDTIATTIESILNQTIKPFEIIVCENHSTDGTREIVESYGDKVRIVRPPKHLGMAANWNYCVNACIGDWVGLCSGDDLLLPNYCQLMTKEIESHPSAVFVMGGWINTHKDKGTREERYLMSMSKVTKPPNTIKMLLKGPKASFAAFTFNKNVFQSVNGYDESYFLIQDWMLQFDMAFKGSFVRLDALVAQYNISNRIVLENKRNILYVKDYIRFINIKLKKALDHNVKKKEVNNAIRIILKRTLYFIIEKKIDFNDLPLADLEKIAKDAGTYNTYERFLKNKKVQNPNKSIKSFLKGIVKKVLQFFK